jgi:hypothetical protein
MASALVRAARLFRLVECDGSHEMFFSNPARLAKAIEEAARD